MSGHSKWSTIKRKKGAADAKRGKIFTKLIKEISISAKIGGGDPSANPRLRTAITLAKNENMPKENIERAIKKGTGELPGVNYEEISYEGYGPGGAAIKLDILTDNKNRTVAEIRSIFSKNGGNLAETGCVSWIFSRKGYIIVEKSTITEDQLMNAAIDAGAEDIKAEGDSYEIFTEPDSFERVTASLRDKNIEMTVCEITMIPQNTVTVEPKNASRMLKLLDTLEDHDDVQNIYSNCDIDDSAIEEA